ncbi:helix-turn-helix domain-containing protein [Priestia filamentosa]|uniref:helix-turn-helix domain-containing protein n=1 Tax=Priestia filamentosa TaxID=1402861 RepID=UPI0039827773
MDLGERLKILREVRNISREDLAQKMNVSRQAVYKWETNKGYPDIENLIKLSELYNTTLDELIKGNHIALKKVTTNEENEEPSTPGFIIGCIILFVGIFFNSGIISSIMFPLGLLIMVFGDDLIHMFSRKARMKSYLHKKYGYEE